jgi:hypothetical protein
MEVTRGQLRAVSRMFNKFVLYLFNSLLSCSSCEGSSIVMMKQYPLPVGLDVLFELRPETSQYEHNSHLHYTSENGLTVLPENLKTR